MSEVIEAPAAPAAASPAAPAAAPAAPAAPAEGAEQTAAQNTAEQAPATAADGEKPKTGQDPEKQSSRRFERRLDRAYRRAAEAEAKAALLEKQLNESKQPSAAQDPAAPKLDQFKTIEEYEAARDKYASDRALKEFQAKQQEETQKQAQARLVEDWEAKAERALEKYDDFQDVVGDLKPTQPWAMAVMEAENAEDVAYYLGKNLKEARRIAALPPLSQVREIGKIEAKLLAEPPKPKTPSKAPAPITPVKGTAPVASDVPSEQDDMGAWIRKRNKQLSAQRR